MDDSDAVRIIERRRDAWLDEDLDTLRGRAALEAMVRRNYERFRPVACEFHAIVARVSTVLAEWTTTLEARATGDRWALRAMRICEVRDGKLSWWREYRAPLEPVTR
jgi:limonene-1,2-epoxide hydrolase